MCARQLGTMILRMRGMRVNAQMLKIQRAFNKRNHSGKAVRVLAKVAGETWFATLKLRPRIYDLLTFAGNVDLEGRGNAVNQFGGDFVLAHHFDRFDEFDAPLIDPKALSGERLRNIAGRNGTE
jgi:hypothetical protein